MLTVKLSIAPLTTVAPEGPAVQFQDRAMRRWIRRSFASACFKGSGLSKTLTVSPSCTVARRCCPTSTPTTAPLSFRSGSGTSHTTAACHRTPSCFTVHSRTGPPNRHVSRIRTAPILGKWITRPSVRTVPGPLSARNVMPRLRDLKRGARQWRPGFPPAFTTASR